MRLSACLGHTAFMERERGWALISVVCVVCRARVQEVSERLQQAELSMAAEREQFKREMALLQEQVQSHYSIS